MRALPAPSEAQPARSVSPRPPEAPPAQPVADGRPQLSANLSLADLERVRQALQLLSEEPEAASGRTAAVDDGPGPRGAVGTKSGDDEDTTPLPVILPDATEAPQPEVHDTPRGPFEPARVVSPATVAVPAPGDSPVPPESAAATGPEVTAVPAPAEPAEPPEKLSPAAAEKLDQIKDLLITAEAIGEVNLDQHFDRVSQRQRELIREFFERARPGQDPQS